MTKAIRLTISGFLRGQFVQNVTAWKWTPISTQTDFESALKAGQAFIDMIAGNYLDCLPVDYIGSSVRAKVFPTTLYNSIGPTLTLQNGFNTIAGTRTGTLSVTSIGPIIVTPFEVASKPRTGKLFLPGVTESDVDNNRLSSALMTALEAFYPFLNADQVDGDGNIMRYQVYSPTNNEIYGPDGVYTSTQVGSIRARQRPHG